jgi:hypothetical protein
VVPGPDLRGSPPLKNEQWWIKPAALSIAVVLLPILLLALPFLAVGAWVDGRKRRRLRREFHRRWRGQGKRLVLVYSNSPIWQTYVEENWLPRLESIAVVLNWSERSRWPERHPLEADIFRTWAGDREFNPLAIVIPADGAVRVFRFWQAFRDYKHGNDRALRAAETALAAALGVPLRHGGERHEAAEPRG